MKKKKVVAIIQARMGSTRLPGKILANIAGKPLLWYIIERLKRAEILDEIVVATSEKERDLPIVKLAEESGVKSFRGSEEDVLDRFLRAAEQFKADIIVRICADNPLTDPVEVDKLVRFHLQKGADYSYNNEPHPKGLPDGVGAEALTFEALKIAHQLATKAFHREHVVDFILDNPSMFHIERLDADPELQRSDIKLDVDVIEDLQYIRKVFEELYHQGKGCFAHTKDIIIAVDALGE